MANDSARPIRTTTYGMAARICHNYHNLTFNSRSLLSWWRQPIPCRRTSRIAPDRFCGPALPAALPAGSRFPCMPGICAQPASLKMLAFVPPQRIPRGEVSKSTAERYQLTLWKRPRRGHPVREGRQGLRALSGKDNARRVQCSQMRDVP
jgi:hypothetical protein